MLGCLSAASRRLQVSISLRGLPIFGSPFRVTVQGGGPYAYSSLQAKAPHAQKRDEITSLPPHAVRTRHCVA